MAIFRKSVAEGGEPRVVAGDSVASLFEFGNVELVGGIRWYPATKENRRQIIRQARQDGARSHVAYEEFGLLGFSNCRPKGVGGRKRLSIALLLAENHSFGGEELFGFRVGDKYGVVALRNSVPVPGFDMVGDLESVKRLAGSYLLLPHSGSVRECGDPEILENASEPLSLDVLLEGDVASARLKSLPDPRKVAALAIATLTLLAISVGIFSYHAHLKKLEEEERLRREQDPNFLYEKGIEAALDKERALGQAALEGIVLTAKQIPLSVEGWELTKIECSPTQCLATWKRLYGSFDDFEKGMPDSVASRPDYVFKAPDLAGASLTTRHVVKNRDKTGDTTKLVRDKLPLMLHVATDYASQLQNYALTELKVAADAPSLFGGEGSVSSIHRPVVSGAWSVEGPLWSLDDLKLPEYVSVDKITIPIINASESKYMVSGKYFAKGKEY